MFIFLSILIFIIPIVLTLGSELLVVKILGFGDKKIYIPLLIISIITDTAYILTLALTEKTFKEFGVFYLAFLLILVIIIEYFFLKLYVKNEKLPIFKLSFVTNSIAFLIGIYLSGLLTGVILWN